MAYITAALNAAHSDHIFHFRDPMQLEEMLRAAGFQPMSLQEEFAAGYKPRKITPSLAGYLVERRSMTAAAHQPWQIADLSLADLLKKGRSVDRRRLQCHIAARHPRRLRHAALFPMPCIGVETARNLARDL